MTTPRIVLILVLLLVGCAQHDPRKEIHFRFSDGKSSPFETTIEFQLVALTAADPLSDARNAYRKIDFRLVAVQGIGTSTPGVSLESSKRLLGPQQLIGVKTVSGTSDMIVNVTHEQMIRSAHEYAKAYNTQMIILLTTNGKEDRN